MLTSILRDSLGGNCKSCFLFTITTDVRHFEESVSTMRFAQRVGKVKVEVRDNTEVDPYDQIRQLTKRIHQLETSNKSLEREKQDLSAQLVDCTKHFNKYQEQCLVNREITPEEVHSNKLLINSIVFGDNAATQEKAPFNSSDRSLGNGSATADDLRYEKLRELDRANLSFVCCELFKTAAALNLDKTNALMQMQSQTSSTAASFAAQRFSLNAPRKSFDHTKPKPDYSASPHDSIPQQSIQIAPRDNSPFAGAASVSIGQGTNHVPASTLGPHFGNPAEFNGANAVIPAGTHLFPGTVVDVQVTSTSSAQPRLSPELSQPLCGANLTTTTAAAAPQILRSPSMGDNDAFMDMLKFG